MRCYRKTCRQSCFQRYLNLALGVLATPLPGAGSSVLLPVSPPTLRAEWLCREVPPPDHVFAGAGLSAAWQVLCERFSGLRFGPRSGAVHCSVAAQWPRLHPIPAPGRLGSGPGSRRHGFPREEAEGRGVGGRGGRQAGEAGWRPERSGGGDRGYRALHELTRLRAQRRGPEAGAAPGGPRASSGGESGQAPEGQLRGDAAAPGRQQCGALDWD